LGGDGGPALAAQACPTVRKESKRRRKIKRRKRIRIRSKIKSRI
jgi:hypothetical protein